MLAAYMRPAYKSREMLSMAGSPTTDELLRTLVLILDLGGTFAFALSGAVPPAVLVDWRYLAVSPAAGLRCFYWSALIEKLRNPVRMLDAMGLALFAVAGTRRRIGRRRRHAARPAGRRDRDRRRARVLRTARDRDSPRMAVADRAASRRPVIRRRALSSGWAGFPHAPQSPGVAYRQAAVAARDQAGLFPCRERAARRMQRGPGEFRDILAAQRESDRPAA